MNTKIIVIGMLLATTAFAGFGGSRSSGSRSSSSSYSSSSRSSSFGGSRSSGAPATIIRPSQPVARSYTAPAPAPVEVHHYHNNSGSGIGSFVTGVAVGNMLSQPRVVAPVVVDTAYAAPVVVSEGHSFLYYLMSAVFVFFIGFCVVRIVRS